MKFCNNLLLICTLFLSQIFLSYTLPITGNNALNKRKIRPTPFLTSFIYFKKPNHWSGNINAYVYVEGGKSVNWPGYTMTYNEKGNFYLLPLENRFFLNNENLRVIFNDGKYKHQAPAAMQEGFKITMDGVYDETGIIGITNEKPNEIYYDEVIYFSNDLIRVLYRPKQNFFNKDDIYAHYKIGNGKWNNVPGDKLTDYWSGYYYINIDVHDAEDLTIAFTDGKKWDNNDGKNYHFKKYDNSIIDNNSIVN